MVLKVVMLLLETAFVFAFSLKDHVTGKAQQFAVSIENFAAEVNLLSV
jgi:hypothetical protein